MTTNGAEAPNGVGGNAKAQLKGFAERISSLEEEKAGVVERIAEEYAAAKSSGLDPKALRKAIKELAQEEDKRQLTLQFEIECDLYRDALGLPTIQSLMAKEAAERIRGSNRALEVVGT